MILIDANILVYAWDSGAANHVQALTWLDDQLNGSGRVALPWESTLAFVRIVTNPRIYQRPATIGVAWRQVEEWLACGNVWIPHAGRDHAEQLGALLRDLGGGSKLVPDAHLAALAIEHGLVLCSCDGDFARFPELRWMNPIRG